MRCERRSQHVWLATVVALLLSSDWMSTVRAEDEVANSLLKTFVEEFVAITPGEGQFPASFQMGSSDGVASEKPKHEVTLKNKFAIAKYEVPQNLYQAIMGNNPSRWTGPRNSVEMMSWKDANEFCQKITTTLREKKLIDDDEVIRLPTEAEWEYCCRAGTTTRYSFGDAADEGDEGKAEFEVTLIGVGENKTGLIKIVRAQTGLGLKEANDLVVRLPKSLKKGLSQTDAAKLAAEVEEAGGTCKVKKLILLDKYGWHTGNAAGNDPPVGDLKPNPWGLYDMHGYLWEFTADGWSDDYKQVPTDGSAMKVNTDRGEIVMRSGSWKDKADKLTSTARRRYSVTDADDAIGFRCVKARTR